ncbi:MAG: fumarylacetoacetase [Phycisphaerales bacterium]|nr:fumarylacetoacetase [Planctomycetota bacterium]
MTFKPDDTHNPELKSWVETANDPATEFPIQNLPLCAFEVTHGEGEQLHSHAHPGVAIGDQILDVGLLVESGWMEREAPEDLVEALQQPYWFGLAHSPRLVHDLRVVLQKFLADGAGGGQQIRRLRDKALRPQSRTRLVEPLPIFNYTDFYASIHHATTVGAMFRPDNPLLPNYKHVPIGYHGRASSIVVSGSPITRPKGQQSPPETDPGSGPVFGPCKLLDYELEVGMYIARGNELGEPVPIGLAHDYMLGLCLVNDWSARDIQKWEYQPLGPFLAKNFATTISPYIVTMDALAPFRRGAMERPAGDPRPLPYLWDDQDQKHGGFEITLEVYLQSAQMAEKQMAPVRLSRGSFRDMYWTFGQMLTHHASNGCNLRAGDLLASGTVSGKESDSRGCLLELTWDGAGADGKPRPRRPIQLPTGETRTFLADGDTVVFKGICEREGYRTIGFGECRGTITGSRV